MQTTSTLIRQRPVTQAIPMPSARRARRPAATTPLSDLDLQAFVDGELDAPTARQVESQIKADSQLQQRHRALQDQNRLLKMWWQQFS